MAALLTDTVASSQMLALAGPSAMAIVYPVSGVLMGASAVLQFTSIDSKPRLRMLRIVALVCGVGFLASLSWLIWGSSPALATGAVWVLGDQAQLLLPLLLWSLAGDVFNTGEATKVYGWILTWMYVAQVVGLALTAAAPLYLPALGIPLTGLLVVNPVICLGLAAWLPWQMRHQPTFKGSDKHERLGEAVSVALEFFRGLPTWRSVGFGVVIVAAAAVLGTVGFSMAGEQIYGSDADSLQILIGGTTLLILVLCWLVQAVVMGPLTRTLGTPAQLLVLPAAGILSGLLLALGAAIGSVPVLVTSMVLMGVPSWTVDDGARQTALTLVPDHLRARVTFLLDLGRYSVAPVVAGILALVCSTLGWFAMAGVLTAVLAAAAVPFGLHARRTWDDSLLNWRLRRRKRTSIPGLTD